MVPLLGEINLQQWFFGILLFLTSLFLTLLVLVQRGRGGGLSGALGGMGGQSAFGAKAGDVFTRITVGSAIFWILLCLAAVWFMRGKSVLDDGRGTTVVTPATDTTDGVKKADKTGDKTPVPNDK